MVAQRYICVQNLETLIQSSGCWMGYWTTHIIYQCDTTKDRHAPYFLHKYMDSVVACNFSKNKCSYHVLGFGIAPILQDQEESLFFAGVEEPESMIFVCNRRTKDILQFPLHAEYQAACVL